MKITIPKVVLHLALLLLVCLLIIGPVMARRDNSVRRDNSIRREQRVVNTRLPNGCRARDCKFVNSNGDCVTNIQCMMRKMGLA